MAIPDTSDSDKMALIGRLTVLRKARRDAAQKLRDRIVPLLNNIDGDTDWSNVGDVIALVEEIQQLNALISELG